MTHEGRVAALLRPQVLPSAALRQGTVVSAQATTVTITIGAGTTNVSGVAYLRGYVPAAGDTVWLLQNGPDLLVLGPAWSGSGVEITSSSVATDQGTASTSYGDLATAGPGFAVWGSVFLVTVGCQAYNATAGSGALMSYEAIGPTSSLASDSRSYGPAQFTGIVNAMGSRSTIFSAALGTWTFKALYRAVTGGTAHFLDRQLTVVRFA